MFSPTVGFLTFLGLTVVLLVFVTWTGLAGRRALHIPLVITTVVSLAVAIVYAKQLGTLYDIESAGVITPVHLTLAKITTAAYLAPVVTGVALLRGREVRRWHRWVAFTVLGMTLITTVTGAWMILASERL